MRKKEKVEEEDEERRRKGMRKTEKEFMFVRERET